MGKARRWQRVTLEQTKDEMLNGRDLSKRRTRKRQLRSAERSTRKVIEQL